MLKRKLKDHVGGALRLRNFVFRQGLKAVGSDECYARRLRSSLPAQVCGAGQLLSAQTARKTVFNRYLEPALKYADYYDSFSHTVKAVRSKLSPRQAGHSHQPKSIQ